MPQCTCGGDAPTEIKGFNEQQLKEAMEYAHGKEPEYMPCTVHRAVCKDCGRGGSHFTYEVNGRILKAGEIAPPSLRPVKKPKQTKRLW
ncbi:hypothetical protein MYOV003v1_p0210 [Vibrio phage 207E48.1]|nr:hypothetical protein MYOV003v1_p0210 [Vibrio phage 207E48.1]